AAAALSLSVTGPAHAVTDGAPDGNDHPYVGIMVAKDAEGTPLWRCSGTLISPTVYVTAGHCTDGAATAEVWFESDLKPTPSDYGYSFHVELSAPAYTHPSYDPDAFYLYDLGVVVLDVPVMLAQYGALPELNQLDAMPTKRGKQNTTFTAVG